MSSLLAGTSKFRSPRLRMQFLVEVLQNGIPIAAVGKPVERASKITLGGGPKPKGTLKLPYYALAQPTLTIAKVRPDRVEVYVPVGFKGFYVSKGSRHQVPMHPTKQQTIELTIGDLAVLKAGDLHVLCKFEPRGKNRQLGKIKPNRDWRLSPWHLFIGSKVETRIVGVGAASAAILLSGILLGLAHRPYTKPEGLRDLDKSYLLRFIAPDHFRTLPEALQGRLQRSNMIGSALDYYGSISDLLSDRQPRAKELLYPSSIDRLQATYNRQQQEIRTQDEQRLATDRQQSNRLRTSILYLPAVRGTSANADMARIVSKIDAMQQHLNKRLDLRRQVTESFLADPAYSYDSLTGKRSSSSSGMKTKGVFAYKLPDQEQRLYDAAEKLAKSAERYQGRLFKDDGDWSRPGHDPKSSSPLNFEEFPVESESKTWVVTAKTVHFPPAIALASYHQPIGDTGRLGELDGIDFDRRSPVKQKEPLTGQVNPHLIERVIKDKRFELQLCYELALRRDARAAGEMNWKWRINSKGQIADLRLVSSDFKDRRMQTCIEQKIRRWRFPKPRDGSVEVQYPFRFKPTQ